MQECMAPRIEGGQVVRGRTLLPKAGGSGRQDMEELLEASRSSGKETVSASAPKGGEGVGRRRKSEIGSPQINTSRELLGSIQV